MKYNNYLLNLLNSLLSFYKLVRSDIINNFRFIKYFFNRIIYVLL